MMKIYKSRHFRNVNLVVDNNIVRKFCEPYLSGKKLSSLLSSIANNILNIINLDNTKRILVPIILEGGKYYYIDTNLKRRMDEVNIGEIIIKSREKIVKGKVISRIIKDKNLISLISKQCNWTIFIGETIASGSTMETFINYISKFSKNIEQIIILGFHTYPGIKRTLNNLKGMGITTRIYSYGGLLGLGRNLTDMTLGNKPNEVPKEVSKQVVNKLGKEIGKKLCMIGDFTYSVKKPNHYIAERIIQFWEIYGETRSYKALYYMREGVKILMTMGLTTYEIEKLLSEECIRRQRLLGREEVKTKVTINDLFKEL